jgi:pyridoxine kinase
LGVFFPPAWPGLFPLLPTQPYLPSNFVFIFCFLRTVTTHPSREDGTVIPTMTGNDLQIPATRVLAVASHVVSGYVGNKIAVFVLQSLGCDVAALNTVQFSNHTGYRQWKGTRVSAQEIRDLYEGLKQSFLDDFDMMLSGYIPGAEAVATVGDIAKELKERTTARPGTFFWVLDPVMGDNGKIYVAEEVVPAYKALIPYADLILPNQFEAE